MTAKLIAAVLASIVIASPAAAQEASSLSQPVKRDGLWNGALAGAGLGALGAAFMMGQCGDGESDCRLVTAQVGFFGLVPASAVVGALIDRGIVRTPGATTMAAAAKDKAKSDPLWNGALIGAAAGVGGAYWFRRANCGPSGYDDECSAIAGPVGALIFIPSGAVVGAVIDKLIHKPPSASQATTFVSPVIGKKRFGAAVVMKF